MNQPFGAPPGSGFGPPGQYPPGPYPPGPFPPQPYPQGPYPYPPQPPRKSNSGVIIALVVVGVLVVLCGGVAAVGVLVARQELAAADDPAQEVVLHGSKGTELTVPGGWTEMPELNERADIEAGSHLKDEYVIVISELKSDFAPDFTLQRYADLITGNMMGSVKDGTKTGPDKISVGPHNGLQYEIDGTVEFVNIHYLVTLVEGKKRYHQVIAWTMRSRFPSSRDRLARITDSFRETK